MAFYHSASQSRYILQSVSERSHHEINTAGGSAHKIQYQMKIHIVEVTRVQY